jgi:hypothetical protein
MLDSRSVCSQRRTPEFWWDWRMTEIPLPAFRLILKQQFMKNANVKDVRVIDRLVYETQQVDQLPPSS